jgi:endonuclease-3
MVTPALFRDFPTPEHLANSSFEELYPYIKSVTYPNSKTKYLLGMARMLVDNFNMKVPDTVADLQRLPGVGRKTANVIAAVIYNKPTLAVDTHVFRVSKRIGLVNSNTKTPLSVEQQLISHLPKKLIPNAHHWLILHGRYTCLARKPKCGNCGLHHFCKYYEKNVV